MAHIRPSILLSAVVPTFFLSPYGMAQECQECPATPSPVCPFKIEGDEAVSHVVFGCNAHVVATWDEGRRTETCNASVPYGTALVDYQEVLVSENHGDHSSSRFTRGNLDYTQEIDEVYKEAYE